MTETDGNTLQAILAEQKKIVRLLEDSQNAQAENLRFLREHQARDWRIREESLQLQRTAAQRFRRISLIVLPLVLLCIALIGWLMFRYRLF